MNTNPNILFAEDETMFLANEIDYLEGDKNAHIQFSEELGQTKKHLKNRKYDLIILDQYLPDSTVEEKKDHHFTGLRDLFFHKEKNKNSDTPVLLITLSNVRNLCAGFKKSGAAERTNHIRMLSKPFREGEFEKAVDEALHAGAEGRMWS